MSTRRGALVLLEGVDRSGKTTQVKRLVAHLQEKGVAAEYLHFPERSTEVGKLIDRFLRKELDFSDQAIHLLYSANRWEYDAWMREKLSAGTTVVMDRYSYSGVAFTAAKGIDMAWCRAPEEGLVRPDAIMFLDLEPEVAASRGGYGDERYELQEFQERVRLTYKKMVEDDWITVNADQSEDTLFAELLEHTERTIEEAASKPLETMWKH